jgi:AcrR family transcriptional regulator
MGRNRSFDEGDVLAASAEVFLKTGYEGTSIDDLVTATGLHRGSIYKAFGSKRGLFLAALRNLALPAATDAAIDLLLVSLLELAPRDAEVRAVTAGALASLVDSQPATTLGSRLLARAGIDTNGKATQ